MFKKCFLFSLNSHQESFSKLKGPDMQALEELKILCYLFITAHFYYNYSMK